MRVLCGCCRWACDAVVDEHIYYAVVADGLLVSMPRLDRTKKKCIFCWLYSTAHQSTQSRDFFL